MALILLWKPKTHVHDQIKVKVSYLLLSTIYAAAAKSLQSCLTLCDPIDRSPPGSPVPGILQARTLEGVAVSFSNAWKWKVKGKSFSRVQHLATSWTTAHQAPPFMDYTPPGSSTHGIFQARVLEWGAIAFSTIYSSLFILWYDLFPLSYIIDYLTTTKKLFDICKWRFCH